MNIVHGGDIYSENSAPRLIDFSANINPLGMPESVKQVIIDNIEKFSSYPDPLCRELRKAIAKGENTKMESILCGNGAADIIFKIALALKPKKALILAPTFSEYEEALKLVSCEVCHYLLKEENEFTINSDILDYITDKLDIIFLCNPNNPTGIPLKFESVIKIAERCRENKVILVVDECFIDFLIDEEKYSISKYIDAFKNLIVLKAFTKIYAMAGIRLGYMLCSDKNLIEKISLVGQPWSVSSVASIAGSSAMLQKDYVKDTKEYIKKNRKYLKYELKKLGFKVFDSKANYIFFKCEAVDIKEYLKSKGILIRSCNNYIGLGENYFRIAVKSREDNEILIRFMYKYFKESSQSENNNGNN